MLSDVVQLINWTWGSSVQAASYRKDSLSSPVALLYMMSSTSNNSKPCTPSASSEKFTGELHPDNSTEPLETQPEHQAGERDLGVEEKSKGVVGRSQAGGDDGTEYPKAGKLALIVIALCLSVFCVALDNTIISTAIPRITDQFHAVRVSL